MSKFLASLIILFCISSGACGVRTESESRVEKCMFDLAILQHSQKKISVLIDQETVFSGITSVPDNATELSLITSFSAITPTTMFVEIEASGKYSTRLENCSKTGLIIEPHNKRIQKIEKEHFYFE